LERGKREFWELGVMRKAAFFSDSVVFVWGGKYHR
jgi:hypothetical protein